MTKKRKIIVGLIILVLAGLGTYFYTQKQSDISKAAEKRFIEMMIPHHEGAIDMAKLADEQATHQETKTLAANIITSQQKEINDMRRWYKDWFGTEVPKIEIDPHAGHSSEVGSEIATTFDQGFVSMMIPHHESAVSMAQEVKPNAYHQEIKDLADAIIQGQTAEIEQMKKLQTGWKNSAVSAGETINYTDAGFDRPNIVVPVGTSVTWISKRSDPNRPTWIASDEHPAHNAYPEFDQVLIRKDEPLPEDRVYTFKFDKPGRWGYHDHNDPGMRGVVTVQ